MNNWGNYPHPSWNRSIEREAHPFGGFPPTTIRWERTIMIVPTQMGYTRSSYRCNLQLCLSISTSPYHTIHRNTATKRFARAFSSALSMAETQKKHRVMIHSPSALLHLSLQTCVWLSCHSSCWRPSKSPRCFSGVCIHTSSKRSIIVAKWIIYTLFGHLFCMLLSTSLLKLRAFTASVWSV